ncbi:MULTISPECIES: hypothetical protein [Nitrosomonas]|uniref:Virion structural protein n=2 Tax=Nitrosomonas communis TaxID=44574 RepID=A0A0F7K9H8_9PROT|nr:MULTISPECIES: hypothetical protein [Nitrosomonas]AKH36900.1 hypothetical protein AAW31_02325 [Nitrosomonas communis]UVS62014.1 hypothetical protein NX761_02455 [Nitrosomonas sp. PLL12]
MAVISGILGAGLLVLVEPAPLSISLDQLNAPQQSPVAQAVVPALVGVMIDQLPVSPEPKSAIAGKFAASFKDDYYNRIHIQPASIDLGNVISQKIIQVEVWNAYFAANLLSSIDTNAGTGISFTGPQPEPTSFNALEPRIYTLAVEVAGPPLINTIYTLNFAAESPTLVVVGRRVILLFAGINWDNGVLERYSFLTDIITSWNGSEQRVKLRATPRREIEVHLQVYGLDFMRKLQSALFGWQSRSYLIPFWPDYYLLSAELPAGSTVIPNISTSDSEFVTGGVALLFNAIDNNESVQLKEVQSSQLILDLPTQQTWPAGTKIYSAKFARIASQQTVTRPTRHMLDMQAKFIVADNSGLTETEGTTLYKGYPVLLDIPNEVEVLSEDLLRPLLEFDAETVNPVVDDPIGYTTIVRRMDWLLKSRKERADFRKWLYARAGRWKPFWMPSWNEDFKLQNTLAGTDTKLVVEFAFYERFVPATPMRNALMIELFNGTKIFKDILSVDEISETEENVFIDSPVGFDIQPQDVKRISYLNLSRLDSDMVEIFHETDTISRVSALIRTVMQ